MSHYEIIRPRQMSRWEKFKRSITLGPWNPRDREIARYFGGTPVNAGVTVNEESVMSFSAVWAAVNIVSAHISSVPLVLYRVLPNGGKERFQGHPIYRLVHDRPNPYMGSALFRRAVQTGKMVWGEGFAEIERDGADRPVALWPLLSYQMATFYNERGELRYRYRNPGGTDVIFEPRDILHVRSHTQTGIEGISAVRTGRESFGLAIAAERFGGSFYGNHSQFGGIISYPEGTRIEPQAKEDNRKAIESRHQGVDRAYRFLTLYEGAKYQQIGIAPNEAQFLETRMFQIEEVCRWFNIPPHKLKHLQRTSYNSIEHQSIEYVTDALDPDWVLWEQELNLKLISPLEMNLQRIEHIREGMLRGDSVSRSDLQSKHFSIAAVTSNEVRRDENRNPVDGGDVPFVALNLIPLDLARPYWEAQIEKTKQPPVAPNPPSNTDSEAGERAIKALEDQLAIARKLTQEAEDRRDVAVAEAIRWQERAELQGAAHETTRAMLEQQLAEANTSLHDAASREQALREELAAAFNSRDEAVSDAKRWEGVAASEAAATDDATKAADASEAARLEAERAKVSAIAERDAALALAEEATTERNTARAERDTARAEREQDRASAAAAQAEAETITWHLSAVAKRLEDERAAASALLDEAVAEREAARAERDILKAQAQDLCAKLDLRDAMLVRADEAYRAMASTEQGLQTESEALKTDLARARADLATEVEAQQKQRGVLLASLRSLFVDATERLLTKESLAARKHQATAEKLRVWSEYFYPMHVETVRHVLRPSVQAWTTVTGGDAAELLERLVSEHIAASRQALAVVLEAEDDDERAAIFERTLRRWDEERADAVADALVREGMGQ